MTSKNIAATLQLAGLWHPTCWPSAREQTHLTSRTPSLALLLQTCKMMLMLMLVKQPRACSKLQPVLHPLQADVWMQALSSQHKTRCILCAGAKAWQVCRFAFCIPIASPLPLIPLQFMAFVVQSVQLTVRICSDKLHKYQRTDVMAAYFAPEFRQPCWSCSQAVLILDCT